MIESPPPPIRTAAPLDYAPQNNMAPVPYARWVWAGIAGVVIFAACFIGLLLDRHGAVTPDWQAGKTRNSPDRRFKAEGNVCSDKSRSWCTMEVVEIATGKTVFYFEQPIGASDQGPWFDQGNALHDGINWAPDSSAVTFEGKNGQAFVVPVH